MRLLCFLGRHDWSRNCEKCATCGEVRSGAHNWSRNCEKCAICGKVRSESHAWSGYKCSSCNMARHPQHTLNSYLETAVSGKDVGDVRALLEAGADANMRRGYGSVHLLIAVPHFYFERGGEYEYLEIARLLLAHGADVNARTEDGETPLHICALYGFASMAKLLLANNADPNAKDHRGMSPLQLAMSCKRRNYEVESLITVYQQRQKA